MTDTWPLNGDLVREWVSDNGLTLHPDKTKIVDAREAGFDLLGDHLVNHRGFPRKKSMVKFKEAIRTRAKRTSGDSLSLSIAPVNQILRGWFAYFQHSESRTFPRLDGRIRMWSLLRRLSRRRGVGRPWPNRYFAEHGLFSLAAAHAQVIQSSRR